MRLSEFDYELPKELIAQEPLNQRDSSRLLVVSRKDGSIEHRKFSDVADYLKKGDVLVLNNTKVIPARLIGKRATGGKVEVLLLRRDGNFWQALIKPYSKLKGKPIYFEDGVRAEVVEDSEESEASPPVPPTAGKGDTKVLSFNLNGDFASFLKKHGQVPLPPYIKRKPDEADTKRYQTVYAEKEGAVAAPTAGLHFTKGLFQCIAAKGAGVLNVTLHVGYGTFKPVKCEDVSQHAMHEEYFEVDTKVFERIKEIRKSPQGGRIFAVGTTSCRVLETIAQERDTFPISTGTVPTLLSGYTNIFIYPPYEFKLTDCLITNFHLPKTTLLMLASAFAGRDLLFKAYKEAIEKKYRFYSYGDTMLII